MKAFLNKIIKNGKELGLLLCSVSGSISLDLLLNIIFNRTDECLELFLRFLIAIIFLVMGGILYCKAKGYKE